MLLSCGAARLLLDAQLLRAAAHHEHDLRLGRALRAHDDARLPRHRMVVVVLFFA